MMSGARLPHAAVTATAALNLVSHPEHQPGTFFNNAYFYSFIVEEMLLGTLIAYRMSRAALNKDIL